MKEEKECINCGKKFIPTCHITRQKFCSDTCRYRYNNAKRHYNVPVNVCPECGDTVEQREGSSGRWRRFCSDQCRSTYHHKKILEQRRSRANPKQVCPNCGKDFQPEWGQGANGNFAVMHVGLRGGRSTEKQIRQKNRRPGNVRFVEHP